MDVNISPNVILRSRVRLARNIVDYPFPPVLNDACRKEIIEKSKQALLRGGYTQSNLIYDPLSAHVLAEEHCISPEFADSKDLRALFTSGDKSTYIMVCEEDHLRIQSFSDGLSLSEAGEKAIRAERLLNEKIRFAFDPKLGYLTHCPTNLGTAMRASVMMFLPALTMTKRMGSVKSQLEKIGMTIRGLYGEGSAADAYMYQISNSLSLGLSESDLLKKTETVALRIAEDELRTQKAMFSENEDVLTDKIFRSLGILKYATMLSGKEFLDTYAYVRLGISLGMLNNIDLTQFDTLLHITGSAHIIAQTPDTAGNTVLRDKKRASVIKPYLTEV